MNSLTGQNSNTMKCPVSILTSKRETCSINCTIVVANKFWGESHSKFHLHFDMQMRFIYGKKVKHDSTSDRRCNRHFGTLN